MKFYFIKYESYIMVREYEYGENYVNIWYIESTKVTEQVRMKWIWREK